jgi:hypothetical protein
MRVLGLDSEGVSLDDGVGLDPEGISLDEGVGVGLRGHLCG